MMLNNRYELIVFDLDGTLLDTALGIFNSVRYTEEKMNLNPIPEEYLRKFVGPPPAEMYKQMYSLNDEQSLEAAGFHREYGNNKAIYESKLYECVPQVLKSLSHKGIVLAVATLKREDIAKKILSYHEIDKYFVQIAGMNHAETDTKAGLIKRVCKLEKIISNANVLMVGDSMYDYEGAKEAGVDFIGVSYGYGFDGTENGIKLINNLECLEQINKRS